MGEAWCITATSAQGPPCLSAALGHLDLLWQSQEFGQSGRPGRTQNAQDLLGLNSPRWCPFSALKPSLGVDGKQGRALIHPAGTQRPPRAQQGQMPPENSHGKVVQGLCAWIREWELQNLSSFVCVCTCAWIPVHGLGSTGFTSVWGLEVAVRGGGSIVRCFLPPSQTKADPCPLAQGKQHEVQKQAQAGARCSQALGP